MEKETFSNKLQNTLVDMKRRLQKEREEAVLLTQHLAAQRVQGRLVEESRARKLELELAAARTQLAEQKGAARNLAEQLASMQEGARAQLHQAESRMREMKAELAVAAQGQLQEQKDAAGRLIQQLAAERDASRAQLSEAESRTRALEEELGSARQQLNEQQQAAETIRQLTEERDESRAQLSEIESRLPAIEEEVVAAQEQFREQREMAVSVIQRLEEERDELLAQLNEQGARGQKLEEALVTTQNQLQEQMSVTAAAQSARAGGQASATDSALNGRPELWRMALPLTLVLMSSDFLAMNLRARPETLEAVREIQLGSQKLLDFLRSLDLNVAEPNPAERDQLEEIPHDPAGPHGTITPT